MKINQLEIKIVLLALVIVSTVIASGYWAYRSLSEIVYSIHQEARPDYKLLMIKDLVANSNEIENQVRLFIITGAQQNFNEYQQLKTTTERQLEALLSSNEKQAERDALIDSSCLFISDKLLLWDEVLELNLSRDDLKEQFSGIYESLERPRLDTIQVEAPRASFFKRLFGKEDTTAHFEVVEKQIEKDELKSEIQHIESQLLSRTEEMKLLESKLLERNKQITGEVYRLLASIEKREQDKLIYKTEEADRLAKLTYRRLAIFSATAVLLLLIVIYMVISHLKKSRIYQQALRKAKTEAEKLTRARESFVANVSHEIRSPVNAIYGLSDQLRNTYDEKRRSEYLSYLLKSVAHLKTVVNDTLDFSKIQADKLKIEQLHFSPVAVLEEVMAIHRNDARNKNIDLRLILNNALPPALIGDPVRLRQILINILSNAIKFTEKGSIRLEVECQLNTDGIYQLSVAVSDTGIGISKDNLELIFEEFQQVEANRIQKYGGTGLGLAIVKSLTELQGGAVNVESTPGQGTTVRFWIPYHEGSAELLQQAGDELSLFIPDEIKKLTVLIADDEEYNRFLLEGIFKKWEVKCTVAKNGSEAVAMALENDYDLLLFDLRMPGLNGMEAARQILARKVDLIILAFTGTSDGEELNRCFEAGMKGVLMKPFTESELLNKIAEVLPVQIDMEQHNTKTDRLSPFDLSDLERQADGDVRFIREMIEIFIRSSSADLNALKEALHEQKYQLLADTAHKMAAPCKHLQAMQLYHLLKTIELKSLGGQKEISALNQLIDEVERQLADIHQQLEQVLQN
ncbi:hybrid sensor histidine kinase/response regulator [Roseimarinus sediminis]|uniref:hybrid sensor histidine kinase/response regulator n=1 Tax=Roseimarinus sediminis TaxID=1610899 RepID=UPI003D19EE8C